MSARDNQIVMQVRLPAAVHQQLTARAEREQRSLNGQIVASLMVGLRTEELIDRQVAEMAPTLGPQVAAAIARERTTRRQKRTQPA